ncbi:hypothetical protein D1872_50500 [compost metagenome]
MPSILDYVGQIFKRKPNKELRELSEAIDEHLRIAAQDLDSLSDQYSIPKAGGEWLEEWGSWFNVYKEIGEQDNEYRGRILSTVSTPKNTIPAIKQAVATYLSSYYNAVVDPSQVNIYEPYTNLMKYSESKSKYSGDDKYPDEMYWRTNVISIVIPYGATEGLKKLLETIKPAGLRIRFDVQLVPEPQNPGSGIPEPVEMNTMIPIEYMFITRDMAAQGTDGFYHPFMDNLIKYSGTKNLRMYYELELGSEQIIDMISMLSTEAQYEVLLWLLYAYPDPVLITESLLSYYLAADVSWDYQGIVETDLSINLQSLDMGDTLSPAEFILVEAQRYLKIIFPDHFPSSRELELWLSLVLGSDMNPSYEYHIDQLLNYNDDEYNIKLSPAYTLAEMGDVPLSEPCWINGATQIDIITP